MDLFSFWALAGLFLPSVSPAFHHSLCHLEAPCPQGDSHSSIVPNPSRKHHAGIVLPIGPKPLIWAHFQ